MIRLLFVRLWPVFIPLLLYVAWMIYRRRQARKLGAAIPPWTDGPWVWAVMATLLIAMTGFVLLGLIEPADRDSIYEPAHMENGTLIQERME